MNQHYQVCSRCVMDTSAHDIVFNSDGVCNYCTDLEASNKHTLGLASEEKERRLQALVAEVKAQGKGKPYDCIVGVSGGVDSSWVLVKAVELGLRPLAVHMDNGWNSELAQNNIENLINGLGVDLYTHVIDWHEYRKLMQAFFDANVVDIELLYDNAMTAVNYQQAAKYGLKHLLAGTNEATEGMLIPKSWNWFKFDKENITSIAKKFSDVKIKTFPLFGIADYIWYALVKKIHWVSILDLMEFNKFSAMQELQDKYGYKPYPYKHYESIFTRFYQGYILPEKFGVDKRRVHLSTLIVNGQITRENAVEDLKKIPYPNMQELEEDKKYFLKKMGWTESQLNAYLVADRVEHDHYPTSYYKWKKLTGFYRSIRG
ncbi:LPS biosynthesis protein WbpG [Alcaligenes pakistanensis]|uniref:LPS biosynthesis protein WbpG n=1 Tax=Alcaligenes pakistanensis TaxID=1482717 RepID=A0A8H9IJW6_9BURK|nr:N-acetyl sugar amidotransferase [Alcaligenes pakistanensis]GHC49770.1 LPS biosynthesis protein WbpG [Alcaligenes pakistanensis]HCA17783.1 N-acetyl sugar amidotransferase [Alcaligenes faecalis]